VEAEMEVAKATSEEEFVLLGEDEDWALVDLTQSVLPTEERKDYSLLPSGSVLENVSADEEFRSESEDVAVEEVQEFVQVEAKAEEIDGSREEAERYVREMIKQRLDGISEPSREWLFEPVGVPWEEELDTVAIIQRSLKMLLALFVWCLCICLLIVHRHKMPIVRTDQVVCFEQEFPQCPNISNWEHEKYFVAGDTWLSSME